MLSAEIHILERDCGDEFRFALPGVVAGCQQIVPEGDEVACHQHLADRLENLSVLEPETLDAVGEVSGGAVGVAAVEIGHEDAFPAEFQDFIHTHACRHRTGGAERQQRRPDCTFHRRLHAQLGRREGVQEEFLHHSFPDDVVLFCGHPFGVEQAAARIALDMRPVYNAMDYTVVIRGLDRRALQKASDERSDLFGADYEFTEFAKLLSEEKGA